MKILYVGHGKWACDTLDAIVDAGFPVVGVVCETDAFYAKGESNPHVQRLAGAGFYASLKDRATGLGLSILQPEDINDASFVDEVDALSPDVILHVSYSQQITGDFLEKYVGKVFNVDGAWLPNYKGPSPHNWAIINGEKQTGTTIYEVTKNRYGDIVGQDLFPIDYSDHAIDVLNKALKSYPVLVVDTLKKINSGTFDSVPMGEGATMPRRTPDDARVDFSKNSEEVRNLVRSQSYPFTGAFSEYDGHKIIFWDVSVSNDDSTVTTGCVFAKTSEGHLKIRTGDSSIIATDYEIDGKRNNADIVPEGTQFTQQ